MFLNFGPLDVYIDGTPLNRKTYGGVTINLNTIDRNTLGVADPDPVLIGGTAIINFYQWPTITGIDLLSYGKVILMNSNITITLFRCRMVLDTSIEAGTNSQNSTKVKLIFTADSNNDIIEIK